MEAMIQHSRHGMDAVAFTEMLHPQARWMLTSRLKRKPGNLLLSGKAE